MDQGVIEPFDVGPVAICKCGKRIEFDHVWAQWNHVYDPKKLTDHIVEQDEKSVANGYY